MSIKQYENQIYAGVLGKILGVYLGRPVELSLIHILDKAIYNVFCDFVTADNKQGGTMAVDHLFAMGHKKIGILAGKQGIYNTRKRVEGYREGLMLKGIPFDESLVYYSEYTEEGGLEGARCLTELSLIHIYLWLALEVL